MRKNTESGNNADSPKSPGALILFGPAVLAALLFGFSARGGAQARYLFAATSYYIIFAMTLCWAWVVAAWLKKEEFSFSGFIRRHRIGLAAALLLSVAVVLSMKPDFQVLSDETNLLAVSKSMVHDRSVLNQTMGRFYFGNFYPVESEAVVEKRPLLFPFVVHFFHLALGYGARSAFLANFVILCALFSVVYALARRRLDEPSSIAAMLLMASYPIVSISAASAGYDLLALLFLFISLISLYGFMKQPHDHARFALLWMNLVMLANVRHESLMFLPLAAGGAWLMGYVPRETARRNMPLFGATLLFMAPLIWQKLLSAGAYENPPGVPLFGFSHFVEHAGIMLKAQADFGFAYPFNAAANLTAFGSLAWFCLLLLKKKISLASWQLHFATLALLLLAAANTVSLAHFFGVYTHPTQARLFLSFAAACALAPVLLKSLRPAAFGTYGLLVLAIATFIPCHASAVTGRFMNTSNLPRESRHCFQFLERQGERHVMVISDRPGQYAALDYGAVSYGYANGNPSMLKMELRRHLFREIYVFQRISYATNEPVPETSLSETFHLAALYEIQITANEFLRISRVVPDEPPAPEPATGH